MVKEKDKSVLAFKGLCDFFDQFGKDENSQTLLEILFEGLINEEAVFVFGEQKQAGNKTDYDTDGE